MSVVDWFYPGESSRAAELDAKNRELNKRREQMGRQTPEQTAAQEARFEATSQYNQWDAQVWDGFKEGWAQGAQTTASTVRGVIAAPINWAFSAIPWQVWALGVVGAFVYLGGIAWIKKQLA